MNVQHEFRKGTLSDESHAFLHGYPTMNPGSTVAGIAECSTPSCVDRITEARKYEEFGEDFEEETLRIECDECKEQPASRKLVADDENDKRFKEKRFLKL